MWRTFFLCTVQLCHVANVLCSLPIARGLEIIVLWHVFNYRLFYDHQVTSLCFYSLFSFLFVQIAIGLFNHTLSQNWHTASTIMHHQCNNNDVYIKLEALL